MKNMLACLVAVILLCGNVTLTDVCARQVVNLRIADIAFGEESVSVETDKGRYLLPSHFSGMLDEGTFNKLLELIKSNKGKTFPFIVEESSQLRYIVGLAEKPLDKAKTETGTLNFKGLYLGMPINHAKATVERITGYQWELTELPSGQHYCFRAEEHDGVFGIYAHRENGKVYKFMFSRMCVDKMFNAYELPPKDFAKAFVDAYKIPKLDWGGDAWIYESPHGFTVVISPRKELVVVESEKRSTDSKPKFD